MAGLSSTGHDKLETNTLIGEDQFDDRTVTRNDDMSFETVCNKYRKPTSVRKQVEMKDLHVSPWARSLYFGRESKDKSSLYSSCLESKMVARMFTLLGCLFVRLNSTKACEKKDTLPLPSHSVAIPVHFFNIWNQTCDLIQQTALLNCQDKTRGTKSKGSCVFFKSEASKMTSLLANVCTLITFGWSILTQAIYYWILTDAVIC